VRAARVAAIGLAGLVGGCIAVALAAVLLFFVLDLAGVVRTWRIPSSAMEPTLHCKRPAPGCRGSTMDRIVTVKYVISRPGRGDIVAFHTPSAAQLRCGISGVYVKRIVGLPGEQWAERKGVVYIDGKRLGESYVKKRDSVSKRPVILREGEYFVMGDNRAGSCDSRNWGPLPRHDIIGKVVLTYWPLSRLATH
jgi:signal peptidase I